MKVLLVTPPYHCGVVESAGTWMPLGLAYLAGALRKAGHDPVIYDAMSLWHDQAQVEARIAGERPDVVAVATITSTYPASLRVLEGAKRALPGVLTVMGGVHSHAMWREVLESPASPVDYVVRGEGEESLPELLDCLSAGEDPARVPGAAFLRDGRAVSVPPRPFIADLDALVPAWDLIQWEIYRYHPLPGSRLAAVSTSRGCEHACSFCSQQKFWERTWRSRSPESVADEVAMLRDRHGVSVVLLADEYPTRDAGRWHRLLALLQERCAGVHFLMETRVEDIIRDAHLMGGYREAGIIHVYIGVEAVSQDRLDAFRKEIKVEQSAEAIRLINGAGMVTETSFVLGMPEETPESVEHTLKLAREYDPDFAHFLLVAPWPYADIHPELAPFIESRDFADYNLVTPVARSRAMGREELMSAVVDCYRRFYMAKAPQWLAMPAGFKKDYLLTSMKHVLKSSFLRKHMSGLGGMPAEMLGLAAKAVR